MFNIISNASNAMNASTRSVDKHAENINASFTSKRGNISLTNEVVGMQMDTHQYQANAKVIKTADSMLKTLLDIKV